MACALEANSTADDLDVRATALVGTCIFPWVMTGGTINLAVVARERILHRILQMLLGLHGQSASVLRDPVRHTVAVHTAPLQPGRYHQVLIGMSSGNPTSPLEVRVVTLNETGHLSGLSTYHNSPLLAAPNEPVRLIRTPELSSPSPPISVPPPVSLSSLSRSTLASPIRNAETPRSEALPKQATHVANSSAMPSPNRVRTGSSLISLPLGSRSSTTVPQAPRNLHLYDMSTMIRSIDKWDSLRGDTADWTDSAHSPLTATRTNDSGNTTKHTSTFPGGAMLALGGLRSNDSSSSFVVSSPTSAHRGSLTHTASSSALSIPSPTSASLSNVSAIAQSLFGHHSPSGITAAHTNDAMVIWQSICVRLFPLFNHETLGVHTEAISDSSEMYVHQVFECNAEYALDELESHLHKFALTGLLSITTKLQGLQGISLLQGFTNAWRAYYSTILPYLQASLLPLDSTASQLAYLHKAAQRRRTDSFRSYDHDLMPTQDTPKATPRTRGVNVRRVLLLAFRDRVVLPIHDWLLNVLRQQHFSDPSILSEGLEETEIVRMQLRPFLIQLSGVLTGLHSDDAAQVRMETLHRTLAHVPNTHLSVTGDLSPQSRLSPAVSQSSRLSLGMRNGALASPIASEI